MSWFVGNLVADSAERISQVEWSVYGKILSITKRNPAVGEVERINYTYDASGNRISKRVETRQRPDQLSWYVRDAQGNVMAVYTRSGNNAQSPLILSETHLYGSSRLGLVQRSLDMGQPVSTTEAIPLLGSGKGDNFTRGQKIFELTNHLGNVLAVVSDRKTGVDGNADGLTDHYIPDITSAQDYYAFGMIMPGRKFSSGSGYRYGFNGKEEDDEVKGDGNQQDYGMRIYDPRLGKFLSEDPITKSYPELTPYQFASNNPIWNIDQDGLEGMGATTSGIWSPATGKMMIQGDVNGDMVVDASERDSWNKAISVWYMGGAATAATVYTGGRAAPLLQKVFWWGVANPHTAQGLAITIITSISGYEGPDIPGPGDDFARLGRKGYEKLLKRGITSEQELGTFARNSYNQILTTIDDEIKDLKTWKEKALKAFDIRGKAKDFARELSGPELKKAAEERNKAVYDNPNGPSFDDLFKKYKTEGKSDDDVYKEIIEAAKRSDPGTNKKYQPNK